jgi:hypothetical protein
MKTFCPISFFLTHDRASLTSIYPLTEDRGPAESVKAFFRDFFPWSERRPDSVKSLANASVANLSLVTTENVPWVYTIVPWED